MSIVKMVNGKTLSRSSSTTGIVEAEHVASPDPPRRSNSRKSCSSASSTKKSRKSSNASSTKASSVSDGASEMAERVPATTMTTATTTLAESSTTLPNSNVKSKSHRKSPFDRRGKHISHMFGAMIFNSLSLLSLLTVAITLTVLGFYVWAGVFYALSLLMLTKVGVDTTKDIRSEIKINNKMKKKKTPTMPMTTTTTTTPTMPMMTTDGLTPDANSTHVDMNDDNADFSWQRLE